MMGSGPLSTQYTGRQNNYLYSSPKRLSYPHLSPQETLTCCTGATRDAACLSGRTQITMDTKQSRICFMMRAITAGLARGVSTSSNVLASCTIGPQKCVRPPTYLEFSRIGQPSEATIKFL